MLEADLSHYGLRILSVQQVRDEFAPNGQIQTTITLASTQNAFQVLPEQLASDMSVMNQVRQSTDPAVKAAYEQMLTVMALTNGRKVPEYNNEPEDVAMMAPSKKS